jgi:hypothetical protein
MYVYMCTQSQKIFRNPPPASYQEKEEPKMACRTSTIYYVIKQTLISGSDTIKQRLISASDLLLSTRTRSVGH